MEDNHGPNCKCSQFKLDLNQDNINYTIDKNQSRCFNEQQQGSFKSIFREEDVKYQINNLNVCQSFKNDPELLFVLRFDQEVSLRALNFITSISFFPNYLGIYPNEENVDFSLTDEEPIMLYDQFHYTPKGETEIYLDVVKCSNLRSVVLHFKGEQNIVGLNYLGLKGFGNKGKRIVVDTKYEILNLPKENSNKISEDNMKFIGN